MGACGCNSGNQMFKLKAPNGWYVIELLRGCLYCSAPSGLRVYYQEAAQCLDDVEEMSSLPTIGEGDYKVTMIKCGLDPDEARSAAIKCLVGTETEDNMIDEILADILGEDFWKDFLSQSPSVIYPK